MAIDDPPRCFSRGTKTDKHPHTNMAKAALNMLIKNLAIEMKRTHQGAVVVGLHPGTVDTDLSTPFQSNLPDGQVVPPAQAAGNLLAVIDSLEPGDSGKLFDWQGAEIPA